MSDPIISVVMGTFNHAPFVAQCIDSVLTQDFIDFEFLISDDGSADQTAEIVAAQTDTRIRFERNTRNRGAALILNELIERARGRYIAVINSDDAWLPGKLSEQVKILDASPNIGAVFGKVNFFDRNGQTIDKDALSFGQAFNKNNRSRGEWLRYFFFHGNCLCHPTVLIRRELYKATGPYDNRLRQLPDLDMWIRVVKHSDIFISESDMINFRILPGENTSSDIDSNRVRTLNEHFFVALDFFSGVTADVLRQGFGDLLRYPELPSQEHVLIESAFLFLQSVLSLTHVYQIVAMMKLRDLLADATCRAILISEYNFDEKALYTLASQADGLQLPIVPMQPRGVEEIPTKELGLTILQRLSTRARALLFAPHTNLQQRT